MTEKSEVEKKPMRTCVVTRETTIKLEEVKEGELFRLLPASGEDTYCDPHQYCLALGDGYLGKNDVPTVNADEVGLYLKTGDTYKEFLTAKKGE